MPSSDVRPTIKLIYLAGPLFSEHEKDYLIKIERELYESWDLHKEYAYWESREGELKKNSVCFIPHRDAGDVGIMGFDPRIFYADIRALQNAKIVIALLDGPDVDSGTAVELGYAYVHKDKKILGLLTDKRRWDQEESESDNPKLHGLNNMVWGVCSERDGIYGTISELTRVVNQKFVELQLNINDFKRSKLEG